MSMQQVPPHRRVVVGVDTHKHVHVAVAIDELGAVLDRRSFAADSGGYGQLIDWGESFGGKLTFGIEGTGAYGAGLAGAVLAGLATAIPKSADGTVEMIRQIKVAKDVAVKARTSAMISLKQVIVNAPDDLRQELQPLSKMALIHRCAALRPGKITTIIASTKHTLRSIARRWEVLDAEISEHEKLLADLTAQVAPDLAKAFAVGPDTAAEMLIVAGDNPERIRSEAAFARLCGVAPIPASSGMTTPHRLNRGGHRQANAALYRVVIVRMQHHEPTKAYVARRITEGKTKSEIIRCLKRFLARELWATMRPIREARPPLQIAA